MVMEHLTNVYINVDDYSLLNDKKLFTRSHIKIERLSQTIQRRYSTKVDHGIRSTKDKQTKETESKKFRFFSEIKSMMTDEVKCSVLKEDQPADSLPQCSSSDAYCHQLLSFISDEMSDGIPLDPLGLLLTSDSHPYKPMLTSDSHPCDPLLASDSHLQSSRIAENDCFENISKGDSFLSNMDTGGSPSFNTHALGDEAGKTAIPSFSCAEKYPPSTGMEIIDFSTEDRNSDDDDGDCGIDDDNNEILWTNNIQTEKTESTIKCGSSFLKFSEISSKKQTDDNSCVLKKEDNRADSQFAEEIYSVENISKEAQPGDSFIAKVDTGSSSPFNILHALVEESGKSAVPSSSFNECVDSYEANCPPSTGLGITNFSTGDGISGDDDGDYGVDDYSEILWTNDIQTGKTESTIKCESSFIKFSEIGAEKQTDDNCESSCCPSTKMGIAKDEDSLVHNGNDGRNSNDDGAVDDDKLFSDVIQEVNSGILQVVKSGVDEDMIGCFKSIETAVNNDDIKVEEDNEDTSCIEKQSNIRNVIPIYVRHTRSSARASNQSSVLPDSTTRIPVSSANKHREEDDVRQTRSSARRSNTSSVLQENTTRTPLSSSNGHEDDDDDDADDDGDKSSADDPSDSVWMPHKKRKKTSEQVTSADKSSQSTSILRSARCRKEHGSMHSTNNSYESDQTDDKFSKRESIIHQDKSTLDEKYYVKKDPIICRYCESTFISLAQVFEHMTIHIDPALLKANPNFVCGDCAATFLNQQEFVSHCRSHDQKKPFRCQICHYRFSMPQNLLEHNAAKHSEPKINCFVCDKRFALLKNLKVHVRWHFNGVSHNNSYERDQTDEKFSKRKSMIHRDKSTLDEKNDVKKEPINCRHCDSTVISLAQVFEHMTIHIDPALLKANPNLVCGDCAATFLNRQEFFSHCRSHDQKKPFRCQICDYRFSCLRNLLQHNAAKHSEPKFNCFVCDKRFALLVHLKDHVRWHFDGVSLKCGQCSAEFTSYPVYFIHISEHKGMKFECTKCDKKFQDGHHWMVHMNSHNRKYKAALCPVCGKRFRDTNKMSHHFEIHHSKEKTIACTSCSKMFPGILALKRHIGNVHSSSMFKCNLCEKSYKKKPQLEIHIRTHTGERPYPCEICSKRFVRAANLKSHMTTHEIKPTEKSFVCKLCDKSFFYFQNLYDHKRVKHNDSHKFICDLCGKVLTRRQTLQQHMKTHEK